MFQIAGHSIQIMCSVCDKPVEHWEVFEDFAGHCFRVQVKCHGDTDNSILTHHFLVEMDPSTKIEAVAFQTKRLEAA